MQGWLINGSFRQMGLGFQFGGDRSIGLRSVFGATLPRYAIVLPVIWWIILKKVDLPGKRFGLPKRRLSLRIYSGATLDSLKRSRQTVFLIYAIVCLMQELAARWEIFGQYKTKFPNETRLCCQVEKETDYGLEEWESGLPSQPIHCYLRVRCEANRIGYVARWWQLDELGLSEYCLSFFASDNGGATEGEADPDFCW